MSIDKLNFEILSEELADARLKHIERHYGENPHVIAANLRIILQEAFHDGIEIAETLIDRDEERILVDETEIFLEGAATAADLMNEGGI